MSASATGRCRCGEVTFTVTSPALMSMACHCKGCQKLTGSAYSLSMLYPRSAFSFDSGETVVGGLHGQSRYLMCAKCKSWLTTEPAGLPDFINVRTPLLDEPPAEPPFIEVATNEGFAWAKTNAPHSYPADPAEEDFPQLLTEFASRGS